MVAIAGAIIRQRTGHFDPSTYRDVQQIAEKFAGLIFLPRVGTLIRRNFECVVVAENLADRAFVRFDGVGLHNHDTRL